MANSTLTRKLTVPLKTTSEPIMKISSLRIMLFALPFLFSQASAQTTPQQFRPDVSITKAKEQADQISRIDSLLQSFVDNNKTSSVAAFAAKDGRVIYKNAVGWKDVENKIPASIDDYYVMFSQTKAITTVAFMTLVEKGLVKIDDPVSKYFPGISDQVVTRVNEDGSYDTRPAKSPMTFVHLMAHTSGLGAGLVGDIRRAEGKNTGLPVDLSDEGKQPLACGQHSFGGNPNSKFLEEEMLTLAKYPLGFDPGTEWNYHVSTNMLGYLVERISGESLRDYVKETILDPLGMHDTDWFFPPDALKKFVKPYEAVDGELRPASTLFAEGTVCTEHTYAEGALGLNGPIEDYAKFCQMLLNKGEFNGQRILKPETVELMTSVNRLPEVNSGGNGFQFGLGFELYNEQKKPVPAVSNTAYAWGGMLGTEYIIDPTNNLIVLFYINMFKRDSLYPSYLEAIYDLLQQ
jgi:CubicO group peptidase (beta-lactamase class C family)